MPVHPENPTVTGMLVIQHGDALKPAEADLCIQRETAASQISETKLNQSGAENSTALPVQVQPTESNASDRKQPKKKSASVSEKPKKPVNPKAHMSLIGLDNIHTLSIISWRRGRRAFTVMFDPEKDNANKDQDDDDDDEVHGWHFTETCMFALYRIIGFFVLISQITFLWSLLDQFAIDFRDAEVKRKPFPVKYTPAMTDRDFGTKPLNLTIADWDAARPAANVKLCRTLVLQCGAAWASNQSCAQQNDIAFNCYPWDYEKYLQASSSADTCAMTAYRDFYIICPSISPALVSNSFNGLDARN